MPEMIRTGGLQFKKLDLHVHTAVSPCYKGDRKTCAQAIVDAALAKGLAGIAITDHNRADGVDDVRDAAQGTRLRVFPGAEITVGDAHIHVIAIFPPSTPAADVTALLHKLHLKGQPGAEHCYAACTVEYAIDRITGEGGGLAVLAHSDSDSGLFKEMKGAPRIGVVQNPRLIAAEAKDVDRLRYFLNGSDPYYLRKLAVYRASDNPHPSVSGCHSAEGVGTACSYFKVDDEISLESLRQCFLDPDVRIRQEEEYKPGCPPHIVSVEVDSGLFENEKVEFHAGLNCVLGAKGSGKSMLIELIRFALGQPPTIQTILDDHLGKLHKRLGLYGAVKVKFVDETGKIQEITRKYDPSEGSPVESADYVRPERVLRSVFLSQNEIVKIAEDEREQLRFIDRFFDISYYRDLIAALEEELSGWDDELAKCIAAYIEKAETEAKLKDLRREEAELSKQLSAKVITDYRVAEARHGEIQRVRIYAATLADRLQKETNAWAAEAPPKVSAAYVSDPALKRMSKTMTDAIRAITALRQAAVDEAMKASVAIADEVHQFRSKFSVLQQDYEAYVRASGGGEKVLETRRKQVIAQVQHLTARIDKLQPLVTRFKAAKDGRAAKLDELFAAYAECHAERVDKCKVFESNSGGRLNVTVHEASNSAVFRQELLSLKRGSYLSDKDVSQLCDSACPRDSVWAMIAYVAGSDTKLKELAKLSKIQFSQLKTLADFLLDRYQLVDLLRLQYKSVPEDRPEIRLVQPDGREILLKDASVGQKCTAMLLMALCDETMPVIIDQPEDSLDNRTVWEDVCAKLRQHKETRQFIMATHNSSLAVASDTDKYIVVEEVDADRAIIALSGSVDIKEVKEEVIKYLEGGRETYLTKYAKYAPERLR